MTCKNKILINVLLAALAMTSCSSQKKKVDGSSNNTPGMIMISDRDRMMANITTEYAVVKNIFETTTLVGKASVDERNVEVLSSRVKGRLDDLLVKNPGEYVRKGQHVYSIYSEELLSNENDYLLALDQFDKAVTQKQIAEKLLIAARKKLLLWTLSEDQINELGRSKKTTPLIKFFSPFSGYVMDLLVREGEYVQTGSSLFELFDLNTLWIETQVYSNEVKYLKQNPLLQIEFETLPNEMFNGTIVFDNPMIEGDQKINLVRVQLLNRDGKVKPGMMAYIYLKRNQKKALVIPKSALLVESSISVWVEVNGMFEQRMVTTGIENKKEVEILSGLEPGDKVVVSGAFFLKSESVIQQGGNDMGGMKM